jgi:tetratricopeptide (TPR) repeat protein
VLEALEKGQPDAVLDAVEEAEGAQLVEPDRAGRNVRYRFVHELVRQTLADSLSLPRRQRLHARIAEAMESVPAAGRVSPATAIAHHLYQAGAAADIDKTVGYLMIAARLASGGAAHEEALSSAEKALSLVENGRHSLQPELQIARAAALRSMARWQEAMDAYGMAIDRSVETGNTGQAVEASVQLAYMHLWRAEGARGSAVVYRALQFVGKELSSLLHQLQLLNAVSQAVAGEMAASLAALSEAKQIEAALPKASSAGFPSMCEARVHFQLGQMRQSAECAHEALRRFRVAGDLRGEAEVFEPVAAAIFFGRVEECGALARQCLPLAERVGHLSAVWAYKMFGAQRMICLADLRGAELLIQEADRLAEASFVGWRFLDRMLLGLIAWYRGDFDQAEERIRNGLAIEPATYLSGQLAGLLFQVRAAQGDAAAAKAALADARRYLPVQGAPSIGSYIRSESALACAMLG